MYCISYYGLNGREYLAFHVVDDKPVYGYYLTDKETFIMNLSNNKREHPTLFKTVEAAYKFIDKFVSERNEFCKSMFSLEWVDNDLIPKCNRKCWSCNKKKKSTCRNLRNPYQNYCAFIMAKFKKGFKPDEKRLDAPCEKCLTKGCPFNMNYY